jgi:hypothetical protein
MDPPKEPAIGNKLGGLLSTYDELRNLIESSLVPAI